MENSTEFKEQTYTAENPERAAPEATTEESVQNETIAEGSTVKKTKGKLRLITAIVAVILAIAVAVVFLLLLKGPNVNELLAGKTYECSGGVTDSDSWMCLTLTFDAAGESFTSERYIYDDEGTEASLTHTTEDIACEPEKVEDGVYKYGDYMIYVNDEGVEKIIWTVEEVEYEFFPVDASEAVTYLKKTAIRIFSSKQVYPEWSAYTIDDIVPRFFCDYDLKSESVSLTQYRVTLSGTYYPVYDMPSYVEEGELTVLVDVESKVVNIEKGTDVFAAMQYYVIQMQ